MTTDSKNYKQIRSFKGVCMLSNLKFTLWFPR